MTDTAKTALIAILAVALGAVSILYYQKAGIPDCAIKAGSITSNSRECIYHFADTNLGTTNTGASFGTTDTGNSGTVLNGSGNVGKPSPGASNAGVPTGIANEQTAPTPSGIYNTVPAPAGGPGGTVPAPAGGYIRTVPAPGGDAGARTVPAPGGDKR